MAVVNLGRNPLQEAAYYAKENELQERDTARENIRNAVATGVKALRAQGSSVVSVDPCADAECAGESAALAAWLFQDLKSADKRKPELELICHTSDPQHLQQWNRGLIQAGGQNLARWLMEMPSNHMTPTIFAQVTSCSSSNVQNIKSFWSSVDELNLFD